MSKKEKSPAFQFYVSDYLIGTKRMTPAQKGGYVDLLCEEWDKGFLPNNDEELIIISGLKSKDLEVVKKKFFIDTDGTLKNERLETERQKQAAYKETMKNKGKNGAANRWHRHSAGIAQPCHEHSQALPDDSSLSSTSSSTSISIIQEKKTRIGTEQFDGTTSEVLYNLKRMMIDPLLMQKYRALDKSVIFAEMDTLYPQGYLFRDENHLFNCFRTVADKLLNSQGTQNNSQTPKIKYTTIE
jgi:uncharacterized protein YdaU (DUF1376 family)